MRTYLSLGSNLGDRWAHLREALNRLAGVGVRPVAVSPVYETEPQGRPDQAWFLNCVVEADTDLSASEVLQGALSVESAMGRARSIRWGPRNIDIDVLLYGDEVVDEPELSIPHPRLHERAFALVPLANLDPSVVIPGRGLVRDLADARRGEPGQAVRVVGRPGDLWSPSGGGPGGSVPGTGGPGGSTRQRVLGRLMDAGGGTVSGETLRRDFGVSRAAVWKHVHALRSQGYPILAASGEGYRMAPEWVPGFAPLSAGDLRIAGRRMGGSLHVLRTVDSTNLFAKRTGQEGAADGTVVVSEEQTAGRGRNGRGFLSPLGGLYLSVVLRPRVPPARAVQLTLVGAVAACEALEAVAGLRPRIKWPNDILLPEGKVCGILLEMAAAEDCVDFIVLGFGINVATAPPVPGACSLWSAGSRVDRSAVARGLLERLDVCYDAFLRGEWPELLEAWRRRCSTLGSDVVVSQLDGGTVHGRVVNVTADGALLVQAADGVHTILAGDVSHVRGHSPAGGAHAPALAAESLGRQAPRGVRSCCDPTPKGGPA